MHTNSPTSARAKFLVLLILQGCERIFCSQTQGWALKFLAVTPGLPEGCCSSCFGGTHDPYMKNSCIIFFPPNITQGDSHQHSFLKPHLLLQLIECDAVFKHIYFPFFFCNKAMHKITCHRLTCPQSFLGRDEEAGVALQHQDCLPATKPEAQTTSTTPFHHLLSLCS